MQKLQMITQEGNNVAVVAVRGNFDDAQTGVKEIFGDKLFNRNCKLKVHPILSQFNQLGQARTSDRLLFFGLPDLVSQSVIKPGEG